MEKGILGIKKDPKNLMLFSFSGGEGWPSSDSSDSDYNPDSSVNSINSNCNPESSVKGKKCLAVGKVRKKRVVKKPKVDESFDGHDDSSYFVARVKSKSSMRRQKMKEMPERKSLCPASDAVMLKGSNTHQFKRSSLTGDVDLWGQILPSFVLNKIFKYVIDSEGALPFLCQVSKINRLWNVTSKQSVLWQKLDLSSNCIAKEENVLSKILCAKNLSQLREINLSKWKSLTNSGIQIIADSCAQLRWIKLSETRVSSSGLIYLVNKCPHLTGFDLSSMKTDAVHGKSLHHVIQCRGNKIKSLNLSFNFLKDFNTAMKLLVSTCSQLEVLEICNAEFFPGSTIATFDIEKMQSCCPQLKILRLSNTLLRSSHAFPIEQIASPGFPHLRELDIGVTGSNRGIGSEVCHNFLHRILKQSLGLKVLNIHGCTSVTCESLQSLPITNLEQLFISSSSAAKYEGIEIIMTKWQHSLVVLDLSWNIYPGMSLDMAMKKLASDPSKSKLEMLDLRGTQISCARVKSILEGCPRLNTLRLDSCRGLPRGMKKEYSRDSLIQLRMNIDSLVNQAEHDGGIIISDLNFFV